MARQTVWGKRIFFISIVANVNEETVRKSIQEQEVNNKLENGRK
mgnify:CR=1 FL=1